MYSVPFFFLFLTTNAAVLASTIPRALLPGCDEKYEEISLVEFNDGPTDSGDASIGAEFETIKIQFTNRLCGLRDTFSAKHTSVEQGAGRLSAEYVLDGPNIKAGSGAAAAASRAAHDDLASWTPCSEDPSNQVIIEDYQECPDPWIVRNLKKDTKKDEIYWAPQIMTSMPLEALYYLMKENVRLAYAKYGRNILNGITPYHRGQNIQLVTAEYFDALHHLKVDKTKINDAVLGFCTLILSYGKAANKPLFNVFNTLACYKTAFEGNAFVRTIDSDYCTGTIEAPVPKSTFGLLQYNYVGNFPKPGVPTTLSIKEWIQGIDKGSPSPDLFTTFDKHYDGSIGGLGNQVERMFKEKPASSYAPNRRTRQTRRTQRTPANPADPADPADPATQPEEPKIPDRTAPLFEFRDLFSQTTVDFERFMSDVDEAIQKLHKDFATRYMKKVRRDESACLSNITINPTTSQQKHIAPDYVVPKHVAPNYVAFIEVAPNYVTHNYALPKYVAPNYAAPNDSSSIDAVLPFAERES
ncbi:hypothetical protein BU23DRAFT_660434 [Bimuria novae-zelandiae CBS 107.79]|uniref:Uncharacterized protein n=1 Tax=Bimuria novae-zelandiae CBS 107.79 TaxID=1447943 RepID=A0A6A5V1G3_9PLEO|nr:hypothetical protein BU23DRAFT_660434 [Bimuria novae-zelandiae CBS 107.79]